MPPVIWGRGYYHFDIISRTHQSRQMESVMVLANKWATTISNATVFSLFSSSTNELVAVEAEVDKSKFSVSREFVLTILWMKDWDIDFFQNRRVLATWTKCVFSPSSYPTSAEIIRSVNSHHLLSTSKMLFTVWKTNWSNWWSISKRASQNE